MEAWLGLAARGRTMLRASRARPRPRLAALPRPPSGLGARPVLGLGWSVLDSEGIRKGVNAYLAFSPEHIT